MNNSLLLPILLVLGVGLSAACVYLWDIRRTVTEILEVLRKMERK